MPTDEAGVDVREWDSARTKGMTFAEFRILLIS